ncbi:hypothetical protein [Deinococcus hopiensis]|uniref:Uncharacterized protein n=1 Tax=Deinococcus hopiensis KR-140 TaxID=695939 RepID=A0A1W1VUG3_9DEIO|nr:hypothetical protein [Deinococcus hopiensis]SMB96998.1 hypothetical protein SAMN00790413_06276 [Deinococcus hopiensis KR-140]
MRIHCAAALLLSLSIAGARPQHRPSPEALAAALGIRSVGLGIPGDRILQTFQTCSPGRIPRQCVFAIVSQRQTPQGPAHDVTIHHAQLGSWLCGVTLPVPEHGAQYRLKVGPNSWQLLLKRPGTPPVNLNPQLKCLEN